MWTPATRASRVQEDNGLFSWLNDDENFGYDSDEDKDEQTEI
jgi:hypothetical protein